MCWNPAHLSLPQRAQESLGVSSKTHGMSAKLSGCCLTLPSQEGAHEDPAGLTSFPDPRSACEGGRGGGNRGAPAQASPQMWQPHLPPGSGASRDTSLNVTTKPGFLQWTEFKDQRNDSNRVRTVMTSTPVRVTEHLLCARALQGFRGRQEETLRLPAEAAVNTAHEAELNLCRPSRTRKSRGDTTHPNRKNGKVSPGVCGLNLL